MNIQGVEILTQKILYSPQWFGIVAAIGMVVLGFFFLMFLIEENEVWSIIPTAICFILFIVFMNIASEENHSTF